METKEQSKIKDVIRKIKDDLMKKQKKIEELETKTKDLFCNKKRSTWFISID